ncbi:MAG: hypothetical protein KBB14_06670 [Thermoanaerobaculia bacterium]|nr:hypothetical protein [Thermoanaerobaculia bacterium]
MTAGYAIDLDDARAFIAAVAGSADAEVTFQTFTDRKPDPCPADWDDPLARVLHGTLRQHTRALVDLNNRGAGIFMMINAGDGRGRRAGNVVALRAVFTDDDKNARKPPALSPSFSVESKAGPHNYWRLALGAALDAFKPAQQQLAAFYGTDGSIVGLPQVMRLPGFFHRKAEPFLVKFQPGSFRTYTIEEVLAAHPVAPPPPRPRGRGASVRREKLVGIVRTKAAERSWAEGDRHASAKTTAAHARKRGLAEDDIRGIVTEFLVRAGKSEKEADDLVSWAMKEVTPDPNEQADGRPQDDEDGDDEDDEKGRKEPAAQVLVRIGERNSVLFHDERETPHAAVGPDGARRIVPVKSGTFATFLSGRYYSETGKAANGEAIATARSVLAAKALFDGPQHHLHNRFAQVDGALWIDLADAQRRAAKVTADGWTIEAPPILFRSFKRQAALPIPTDGGDLSDLLDHVNVQSAEDGLLLLTWTALAPLGHIPRPILELHGPQGSAKTTTAKMLRRLTDPSAAGTNHLSNKDDELALAFETNAVPFFDNLTHISARQAELMCQAVTGGGFTKRELYSDSDEVVYDFRRAIIITGINPPTLAPDLLDRFLGVGLERVRRDERVTESALWRSFDAAAPALFGGLLTALSGAMRRHPCVVTEGYELERMADWTLWGLAVAESLGATPDAFLAAYRRNVGRQTEEVLEADPIARAVRELAQRGGFSGTPSDLFKLLRDRAGDEAKTDGWPKRADGLSRRLNVLRSTLADAGVSVTTGRAPTVDRGRIVTISLTSPMYPGTASNASNASKPPRRLDAMDALDANPGHIFGVSQDAPGAA